MVLQLISDFENFTQTNYFLPVKRDAFVLYTAASMLLVFTISHPHYKIHLVYILQFTQVLYFSLKEILQYFRSYIVDYLNIDHSNMCWNDMMILCWQDSVGVISQHRLVHTHSGHGHVQGDPSLRHDQWHVLQVRLTCNLSLDNGP